MIGETIQSLWIGSPLTALERLSIRSFLRQGHEYHLYAYEDVIGLPPGAALRDAREILPQERIFHYHHFESVAGFSNLFRYKLLYLRGGWWADLDVVCLAPFLFAGSCVVASERTGASTYPASCVLRFPPRSDAMLHAWEVCESKDPDTLRWGETGPALVSAVVDRFQLHDCVQDPDVFCPVDHLDWHRVLDSPAPVLPPSARAVHLWNEKWRRAGQDKNASYDERSLYEQLKSAVGT